MNKAHPPRITSWPTIRTNEGLPKGIYIRALVCGTLTCAFAISILMLLFMPPPAMITWGSIRLPQGYSSFVISAGLLSLLAMPIAYIALRFGFAGWLVAMLCASVFSIVIITLLASPYRVNYLPISALGATCGLAFWLGMRIAVPAIFTRHIGKVPL